MSGRQRLRSPAAVDGARLGLAPARLACSSCVWRVPPSQPRQSRRPESGSAPVRVLMLTATAGFRHDSIATARQVVTSLGTASGFSRHRDRGRRVHQRRDPGELRRAVLRADERRARLHGRAASRHPVVCRERQGLSRRAQRDRHALRVAGVRRPHRRLLQGASLDAVAPRSSSKIAPIRRRRGSASGSRSKRSSTRSARTRAAASRSCCGSTRLRSARRATIRWPGCSRMAPGACTTTPSGISRRRGPTRGFSGRSRARSGGRRADDSRPVANGRRLATMISKLDERPLEPLTAEDAEDARVNKPECVPPRSRRALRWKALGQRDHVRALLCSGTMIHCL